MRLNFNKNEIRLELEDDGEGFGVADRHNGFGLIGMRERVEQMGGTLTVTSIILLGSPDACILSMIDLLDMSYRDPTRDSRLSFIRTQCHP
jgi:glucose-6-phosphate-specific signal transduction histidine kinase